MRPNRILCLLLVFYLHETVRSLSYVSSHDIHKTKFQTKLREFVNCADAKSRSKPLEVISCLNHMKLESDPYWQVMVINGLAHFDKGESDIVEAIKTFQQIKSHLDSRGTVGDIGWNHVKDFLEAEVGYSGDFPIDDEDGSGSGSYSGFSDDEGSGHALGGKLEDLDKFIEEWNRLLNLHGGPHIGEPNEEHCTAPFIDVAYKVCILPVLDRQLTWHDAHQYCRHRSLDLAMESAVIKGRKYFNNQLGLSGTRERWTLWVGARKDDTGNWLWNDELSVPGFVWAKNQPRSYARDSTPAGTCMAIHGFAEYYGTAVPCHHRRRFFCQKV